MSATANKRDLGEGPERPREGRALAARFHAGLGLRPGPRERPAPIADSYGHFINGAFVDPVEGGRFETVNPATEEPLSSIANGSEADVARAVDAARDALPAWSALPGKERAKYIFRIARRLQERAREFAVLETRDGGKPIKESRDVDVPLAAAHFFYHAGGQTNSGTHSRGATRNPWACAGRSSRGTSRC